jgi:biopolymer transport protein ExbD
MIDLTPMIDVVFQLVLFFMVSTTFVASPGIQVELPKSSAQVVVSDQKDVSLWLTLEGSLYLRDRLVTQEGLAMALRAVAESDPKTLVKIQADAGVTHGDVVALMDAVRTAGLNRLAIATDTSGVDDDP